MGDLVQLRSGGPQLTVAWVEQGTEGDWFARVEWIDSTGVPQSKEYPIAALVLVSSIISTLP